jgi:hypothetical protein
VSSGPGAPGAAAAALILGALAAGCASGPAPESLPPQTVTRATPEPPPPSEPPVAAPVKDSTVVVIDPGDPDAGTERSLGDASRAERERRQAAGKPAVVITDKNLAEYATGQLTTAEPGTAAAAEPTAAPAHAGRGEEYWRGRGLEIRRRWREAVDRVSELEAEAARLRTRFYAEDDPYVRDGQVKPQWDRALERLEESRAAAESAEAELETFLEEGQRAGALQGWLEEGADLEPPPAAPERRSATEPGEPDVIEPVAEEPPR